MHGIGVSVGVLVGINNVEVEVVCVDEVIGRLIVEEVSIVAATVNEDDATVEDEELDNGLAEELVTGVRILDVELLDRREGGVRGMEPDTDPATDPDEELEPAVELTMILVEEMELNPGFELEAELEMTVSESPVEDNDDFVDKDVEVETVVEDMGVIDDDDTRFVDVV